MANQKSRKNLLLHELKAHLPFTLLGVLVSILFLFGVHALLKAREMDAHEHLHDFYHFFHTAHVLLSAVTSAAIVLRHHQKKISAIVIACASSILFCTLSDILLPYLGGILFGQTMTFHFDLIEKPLMVLGSALIGSLLGITAATRFNRISYWSHSSHVFVSSLASLFYLVSFGFTNWVGGILGVFIITSLAVVIPCCSSDILFPVAWVSGLHGHEHEDEHTHHH